MLHDIRVVPRAPELTGGNIMIGFVLQALADNAVAATAGNWRMLWKKAVLAGIFIGKAEGGAD